MLFSEHGMNPRSIRRINCIIFLICILTVCLFQAHESFASSFISGQDEGLCDRMLPSEHLVLEDAISPVPVRGGEIRKESSTAESLGNLNVKRISFCYAVLLLLLSVQPNLLLYLKTEELSGLTFCLKRIILFRFGKDGLKSPFFN